MALAAPCQLSVCIEVQPEVNCGSLTGGVWDVQLCAQAPTCTHRVQHIRNDSQGPLLL